MVNYNKELTKLLSIFYKCYDSENEIIKDIGKHLIKVLKNEFEEDTNIKYLLVLNDTNEYKEIFGQKFKSGKDTFNVGNNSIIIRFLTHSLKMFQGINFNDYYIVKPNEYNSVKLNHRDKILNQIVVRLCFYENENIF